jgi:long-chain acyl-CoA synthetase
MSPSRQTLLTYLDHYIQHGRSVMIVHTRGLRHIAWSYEQVVLTARRIARELESRGIAKGQRVLLCGENSPEWVSAFWGCLLRGVVVVPLDKESKRDFIGLVQKETDARLIFGDQGNGTVFSQLGIPFISFNELEERLDSISSDSYPTEEINADTIVEIIFTSGTTSTPKGVVLTHRNLLANLLPLEEEIAKYAKWKRPFDPIRFLSLVPLSHVFGQFMGVFVPQLLGGEVHFHDSFNPAQIVRRTRESRISVMVLVPRMLESLRDWIARNYAASAASESLKLKLSKAAKANALQRWWLFRDVHRQFGWKFWAFISGGATLDEATESFWRKLGFAVLQGYGMTETASLVTVSHPFKIVQGSIGKPLPGYEVKLDQTGEIVVRGPSVSSGYWTAEGNVDKSVDEWLRTGDLGTLDEAGNLYFKGREKDIIVTAAGLNVYPEDLEQALNSQPEVQVSCVIRWPTQQGDEPLAVLILRDSGAASQTVIDHANERLAEHQKIRHWRVWTEPDFPRTATQKVLKREVAARISTHTASIDTPVSTHPASFVIAAAEEITGQGGVEDSPSLQLTNDLKLDSLGRIELLSALEDRYQIEIDEAAFTAATTVEEVERIVRGELEQRATPYPFPKWSQRFPVTWIRVLLFYSIILPITKIMSRMHVVGREHVAHLAAPVLFVANHVTLADHALILSALPASQRHRLSIAMEGERLRDWLHPPPSTNWFMRLRLLAQYFLVTTFFHVFPLPRRSGFRQSFRYAGNSIDRGESVLVFPEGERAPVGQMHMSSFKIGIGVLARELNVPVVPIRIEGLYELKQRQQYFAAPGQVAVIFGTPIKFDSIMKPVEITEELQRRVADLK